MNNFGKRVMNRIAKHSPKGGLDATSKFFLFMVEIKEPQVKGHSERVALLSEKVAEITGKDPKAAFFGGLLHDTGKSILDPNLFDGHNISAEEYMKVKTHAQIGAQILRKIHLFSSLCAGLHHNVYASGYGLSVKDFPKNWSPGTVKKLLEIAGIISICDFVDAATHRDTEIKDGSNKNTTNLKEMLFQKYPDDKMIVEIALRENKKLNGFK